MDEFLREETPRARKEHKCDLCHQMIAPGEKYVHVVGSESGYIWDFKYHSNCKDIIERYCRAEQPCDGYDDWAVIDDVIERVCCDCTSRWECKYRNRVRCRKVIDTYRKENGNERF